MVNMLKTVFANGMFWWMLGRIKWLLRTDNSPHCIMQDNPAVGSLQITAEHIQDEITST